MDGQTTTDDGQTTCDRIRPGLCLDELKMTQAFTDVSADLKAGDSNHTTWRRVTFRSKLSQAASDPGSLLQ